MPGRSALASLTAPKHSRDDRRAPRRRRRASLLISASLTSALALCPSSSRAADEDARAAWAAAVPRLSIGAVLGRGRSLLDAPHAFIGAYARLSWPLERVRPRARVAGPRPGVAERMAALRRRLAELQAAEPSIDRQLDLDEAAAELSALDGDVP